MNLLIRKKIHKFGWSHDINCYTDFINSKISCTFYEYPKKEKLFLDVICSIILQTDLLGLATARMGINHHFARKVRRITNLFKMSNPIFIETIYHCVA